MWRATSLAWVLAVAGCGADSFLCTTDLQCAGDGGEGVCTYVGGCAFPDETCASGLRFGDHGPSAGLCVGPMQATTTTEGSEPTSSGSASTGPGVIDDGGTSSTGVGTTGEPVDPDLVAWYRFEASALGEDATLHQLHGQCADPQCPVAAVDRGIELDGIDDRFVVDWQRPLDLPASFTVTAWARISDPADPEFRTIVARPVGIATRNSFELGVSNGTWVFAVGDESANASVISTVRPVAGAWTFVTLRYDAGLVAGWVDGVLQAEVAAITPAYDFNPMTIGGDIDDQTFANFWGGGIDDLRIYARGLSEEEILAVMRERGAP